MYSVIVKQNNKKSEDNTASKNIEFASENVEFALDITTSKFGNSYDTWEWAYFSHIVAIRNIIGEYICEVYPFMEGIIDTDNFIRLIAEFIYENSSGYIPKRIIEETEENFEDYSDEYYEYLATIKNRKKRRIIHPTLPIPVLEIEKKIEKEDNNIFQEWGTYENIVRKSPEIIQKDNRDNRNRENHRENHREKPRTHKRLLPLVENKTTNIQENKGKQLWEKPQANLQTRQQEKPTEKSRPASHVKQPAKLSAKSQDVRKDNDGWTKVENKSNLKNKKQYVNGKKVKK